MKSNPSILFGILFIGQLSNFGIDAKTYSQIGEESKLYKLDSTDEKAIETPEEIYSFKSLLQNDKVIKKREADMPRHEDFDPDTSLVERKSDHLANAFAKNFERDIHKFTKGAGDMARNAEGFAKDITKTANKFGKTLPDFVPNVNPNNLDGFQKRTIRTEGTDETKVYKNKYGPNIYETVVRKVQPPRDKSIITKTSPEFNMTIISDVPANTKFDDTVQENRTNNGGLIHGTTRPNGHGLEEDTIHKKYNIHGNDKNNTFNRNGDRNSYQGNKHDNRDTNHNGNTHIYDSGISNKQDNTPTTHELEDRYPENTKTNNNEDRGDKHVNNNNAYKPDPNYNPDNYGGSNDNTRTNSSPQPSSNIPVEGGSFTSNSENFNENSNNFNTNSQNYNPTVKPNVDRYDTNMDSNYGRTNSYPTDNFNSNTQNYKPTVKPYYVNHDMDSDRRRTYTYRTYNYDTNTYNYNPTNKPCYNRNIAPNYGRPYLDVNKIQENVNQLVRNVEKIVSSRDDGLYINIVDGNTHKTVVYPNYHTATTTYISPPQYYQYGSANIGFQAYNIGTPNYSYGSQYNKYGSQNKRYDTSNYGVKPSGTDYEASNNQQEATSFQESNINTVTYNTPIPTYNYGVVLPTYYPNLQIPYQVQYYTVPYVPTQSYISGEYLNRKKRSNIYNEMEQQMVDDARQQLADASRQIEQIRKNNNHRRRHKTRTNYDENDDDDDTIKLNNRANNIVYNAVTGTNNSNRNNGYNTAYNNTNRAHNTYERSGNYIMSPSNNDNIETKEHNSVGTLNKDFNNDNINKEKNTKSEVETNFQILQPNNTFGNDNLNNSRDINVNNFKPKNEFETFSIDSDTQSFNSTNLLEESTFVTLNKTDFTQTTTEKILEDQVIKVGKCRRNYKLIKIGRKKLCVPRRTHVSFDDSDY